MSNKLPPIPIGMPPGSSYWNDWYEKVRTLVNGITGSFVQSFNSRTGVVALTSGDVTGALGYTPAPTASPALTGNPTAPTPADGDNDTSIATTAFVTTVFSGPAFSAYQSSAQSLTSTEAKISFQTEEYDTNSNFDSTTNYRFTPTRAGYYLITAGVRFGDHTGHNAIALYKNGSRYGYLNQIIANGKQMPGTILIQANGTTDYFEIWGFQGVTTNLVTGAGATYFQAFLARAA